MTARITVDAVDDFKQTLGSLATDYLTSLQYLRYGDLRVEVGEGQVAFAENGNEKYSGDDYGISFGIRVLAGKEISAPGYYGRVLGKADLPQLERIVRDGIDHAYRRALANAARKVRSRERFGPLGETLYSTELANIDVRQAVVPAQFEIDPRSVPLAEISSLVRDVSRQVGASDAKVKFNFVSAFTQLSRELFCSSEGANIDQTFAMSQGMTYVVAINDQGVSQELYDYIGHQRGWEAVTRGANEQYIRFPSLLDFSLALTRDACELTDAPPLPSSDRPVTVVTDPHYNALLVHEIVGHPTELDRALKLETSYAGRTWLFRDLDENMIGKRIGSEHLSAYSDPSLPGYGHYDYDDEGTPARKVVHIDRGIFQGFMNSRQTARILGAEPNGSYKATDASLVPLIRMSNTVFAAGDRDPQEMIREVDHGYYFVGHRTPSIAESRENFRISAQKVYEIENGEIGQVYRNGGIMADSRDFFMNVDAAGTDFRLFPIPNCGKGQPMQTKKLGNGGPTLRSRARVTGGG